MFTHSLIKEWNETKASGWIHSIIFQLRSLTKKIKFSEITHLGPDLLNVCVTQTCANFIIPVKNDTNWSTKGAQWGLRHWNVQNQTIPPKWVSAPTNSTTRRAFCAELLLITVHHYALTFGTYTAKCKHLFFTDKLTNFWATHCNI